MKKLQSFLHSAIRFPAKFISSPPVAPWPPLHQSSFDEWFSGELAVLKSSSSPSTKWLLSAFDVAVAAQKTAIRHIMSSNNIVDGELIEEHLEDVIDLLDICNTLRETIENVKEYVKLLRIMLHWLDGEKRSKTGLERAQRMLSSCEEIERKFIDVVKLRSFSFGKQKGVGGGNVHESCEEMELYEVLNGSKAMTYLACGAMNQVLSLKPKRGGLRKMKSFGKTMSCSSVLFQKVREEVEKCGRISELRDMVMAVKQMRNVLCKEMKDEDEKDLRVCVEGLKRMCEGIEGEIVKPLEGKIDQLYKDLISVRLGLLKVLSGTQIGMN